MAYKRSDFAPLRETVYGVGFHWTTWTWPQHGELRPFPEAVETFDVPAFVEVVKETGAGHVLFTATHLMQWLPAPHPAVDRILAGRTCERDLLMELADALAAVGIRFILYYNHGAHGQDKEWAAASGATAPDRAGFFENICRILAGLGERYREKVIAFWLDGGSELARGPDTPWAALTAAAKAGYSDRLVCYNPGLENLDLLTQYQDFWAGEVSHLEFTPSGPHTPTGLPWYSFVALHRDPRLRLSGLWGIDREARDMVLPSYHPAQVLAYLERFRACGGAVTFNLLCYQDGGIYNDDLGLMREVGRHIRREK